MWYFSLELCTTSMKPGANNRECNIKIESGIKRMNGMLHSSALNCDDQFVERNEGFDFLNVIFVDWPIKSTWLYKNIILGCIFASEQNGYTLDVHSLWEFTSYGIDFERIFLFCAFHSYPQVARNYFCYTTLSHITKGLDLLNRVLLGISNSNFSWVNAQQQNIVILFWFVMQVKT